LAISMHAIPGFKSFSIPYQVQVNGHATSTTYNLNFDKIAVGLILFGLFCFPARSREEWRTVARHYPLVLGVPLIVLAVGLLTNYIVFDPKIIGYMPVLVVANLLFTCVPEEAFFRGFLQEKIMAGLQRRPYGAWIAMAVVPVLFGLVHANGGALFVVLAILAGVGYGYAYYKGKRIEVAILAHVLLNTLNVVAFSRPSA
jgi:membrane protease YdiL (CAAX protease family)